MGITETIVNYLEQEDEKLAYIAKEIWDHPQIGLQETFAADLLARELALAVDHADPLAVLQKAPVDFPDADPAGIAWHSRCRLRRRGNALWCPVQLHGRERLQHGMACVCRCLAHLAVAFRAAARRLRGALEKGSHRRDREFQLRHFGPLLTRPGLSVPA